MAPFYVYGSYRKFVCTGDSVAAFRSSETHTGRYCYLKSWKIRSYNNMAFCSTSVSDHSCFQHSANVAICWLPSSTLLLQIPVVWCERGTGSGPAFVAVTIILFDSAQQAAHSAHIRRVRLAVWLSGNALASINVVALRQTRLVLGWVTVCGRVNHFGM